MLLWINYVLVETLLFFPYFMEHQVTKHLPYLAMSDYKVNYANHSGYRGGPEGKERGSPARLYTDIPLRELVLTKPMGYKYVHSCSYSSLWSSQLDDIQ